ncbi:MAG: hypothetical protein K2W78_16510 [Xanthobacteraceae bacterium]|nr:hypothetical protein [Xanthobacteraceae bacterium]
MQRLLVAVLAIAIIGGGSARAFEQGVAPSDFPDETSTRQAWQTRLEESRKRSQEFVARARIAPIEPLDTAKEQALAQDQLVVNDESLQRGDIISTTKGLFMFNGTSGPTRQPSDFVPIARGQTN